MAVSLDDRLLLAYAAGALDPGDAASVAASVAASPSRARALARYRALLGAPPELLGMAAWPGVGAELRSATAMDAGALAPGARLVLELETPSPDWWPVLVREEGDGQRQVVHPSTPADRLPLAAFRQEEGRVCLDLVVEATVAWTVILGPPSWEAAGQAGEPWDPLLEAAERGELPSWRLVIGVTHEDQAGSRGAPPVSRG